MITKRYRVAGAHRAEPGPPLELEPGDPVTIERRPTPWAGWVWCTDRGGRTGWAPETWLTIDGETAVAARPYTSRELDVRTGDLLEGACVESGWLWATHPDGRTGWVPLDVLERGADRA